MADEDQLVETIRGLREQKNRLETINPRTPEQDQELQAVRRWLKTAEAELDRLQNPES